MGSTQSLVLQVSTIVLLMGIAFAAGKHSARIDALERWKEEFIKTWKDELKNIQDNLHGELRDIKQLILGHNSSR